MADKLIGKLTLDISDIENKVKAINKALGDIGKNAQVKISIADEVKKQIEKIYDELEKGAEKVKTAADKVAKSMADMGKSKIDTQNLKEYIAVYKEYYQMQEKALTANKNGDFAMSAYFQKQADDAKMLIEVIKLENDELAKQAEASKAVSDAKAKLYSAQTSAIARDNANAIREEAKALEEKAKAERQAVQEQGAAWKQYDASYINEAKQAYFELTNAIKNYNSAKREQDATGMATYQSQIDAQMQVISGLEQAVATSQMEANAKQQVLNIIEQCKTAERQHTAEINGSVHATSELEMQMSSLLSRMFSIIAVIRTISNLIKNTVEYVSQFSQKMNEIQVITQKSGAEVDKLGKTYRQIAQDMNVSTLDMADAAIYFTRQGLLAEEIEERLRNVTMYAKTANVEFRDASEIMTAVVNSMNLAEEEMEDGRNATQRVADTFLAVGDAAATSGQEIGEAMQKAAASAGAFGVSFEWLTAAIATVSETTRQEARTIGTAFNTIIARLHQIKQNGYNQEDETKINDVAKALAKIDVALMDNEGNWRNMEDVWNDVAEKWGDLDGKTKSYIATTMAGVKQQNVFLAAMNDMSNTVEEGGRFWELYGIAMNSAGTASEKYGIYLESVEASQERLTLAQEKFYATLLNDDVIITWNNYLAGIINLFAEGTAALGGMNIALPITIALISGLGYAIANIATIWEAHPVLLAIAGVVAAITAITAVAGAISKAIVTSEEAFNEANESIQEHTKNIESLRSLQTRTAETFADFGENVSLSAEDLAKHNELLEELCKVSPVAKRIVGELKDGVISEKEAIEQLNDELERQIENEEKKNLLAAAQKYGNYQSDDVVKNMQDIIDMQKQMKMNMEDYEGLSDEEIFTKLVGNAYAAGRFTKDLREKIEAQIKGSNGMDEQDWGAVGQIVWAELFGTYDMSVDPVSIMEEEVVREIDNVVDMVGRTLNDVQRYSLKQYLLDMILGNDQQLSLDEYNEFGNKLKTFLYDFIENGIDSVKIDPGKLLQSIGTDMFGNYFDMYFDPEQIKKIASDPEKVNAIASAYTELLEAGFSSQQLAGFYKDIDMSEWDRAVDYMKEQIRNRIHDITRTELGTWEEDLDTGETIFNPMFWNNLDIPTLQLIEDMVEFGVSIDNIKTAMANSSSIDEFKTKLTELGTEAGYVPEVVDEAAASFETFAKDTKNLFAEIDKITGMLESLKNGEAISFDDIIELSASHPEVLENIHNMELLADTLQKIRDANLQSAIDQLKTSMYNDLAFAEASPFDTGGKTLLQYMRDLADPSEVESYVDNLVTTLIAKSDKLENVGHDMVGNMMTNMFDQANMNLLDRKILEFGDHYETMMTETLTASEDGSEGMQWHQNIVMNFTPITPDGEKLDDESFYNYIQELLDKSANLDELKFNDAVENGGLGLLVNAHVGFDKDAFAEMIAQAETEAEVLHLLQQAYYDVTQAEETWLQKKVQSQQEAKILNEATANNYRNQIQAMMDVYLRDDADQLEPGFMIEDMMAQWNTYFDALKDGISDTYPELAEALLNLENIMNDENATIEQQEQALYNLFNAMLRAGQAAKQIAEEDITPTSFKDVQETTKDIESLQNAIDALDNNEPISGDDLLNLTQAHPELVNYINDVDKLRAKLQQLQTEQTEWRRAQLADMIMQSPEWKGVLDGTQHEAVLSGFGTIGEYAESLDKSSEEYKDVIARVQSAVDNLLSANEGFKGAEETWLQAQVKAQEAAVELQKAKDNRFKDQLNAILKADTDPFADDNGYDIWKRYSDDMKKALGEAYPEVQKAMMLYDDAIRSGEGAEEASLNLINAIKIALASIPDDQLKTDLDLLKEAESNMTKLDNAIKTLSEGKKISFNDMLDLMTAHPEIMAVIGDVDKLKAKLAELRADSSQYDSALTNLLMNNGAFMGDYSQYYDPENKNGKGPINNLQQLKEQIPELADQVDTYVAQMVQNTKNGLADLDEATEDFLQKKVKEAEEAADLAWAKTTGYSEQVAELTKALGEGGEEGAAKALEVWNGYSEALQTAIISQYPEVARALLDMRNKMDDTTHSAESMTNATNKMSKALTNAQKSANAKYFKETYTAIDNLKKGTTNVTKAYETFNKQVDKYKKAAEEVVNVNKKISTSEERTEDDVKNLASVLGIPAEQILADWPAALKMFENLKLEGQEVYDALNREAFFKIIGTSMADFSDLESGLISVQNLAEDAVKALIATGQWKLETMDTPQTAAVWHPGFLGGGYWSYDTVNGTASYLVPTGDNPFKGSGGGSDTSKKKGGGGGGGGGNKNKSDKSEIAKMLDQMNAVDEIQNWQQSFYQSNQKLYESTGQIQGVIKYLNLEREAILEQDKSLQENVKWIEEQLAAKRAELATLKEGSDEYKECEKDIDLLQKSHQKYTKTLVDNKAAEEDLTKAIKEQRDTIRDMKIDLRETIYQAIEDRERKRVDMLNGEVEVENMILEIIKRRYEVERDAILETTNKKIEALREERDLLEEQLQLRKEQNEKEEKAVKLAQLEEQYKRISADPTRAKEALKIRKEIAELRDEIAWDTAEEEVKAQQDSIDQQIESLEDYLEQVKEYYEDLFEHPQQLIAEMREIMQMTDDEIIEWLKANDEEYASSSENRRAQIVEGWQEMLDTMRGTIRTYWDEVEEIIAQGDEAIINFLKENSAEYGKAGKLQAEKFVDGWIEMLEKLKKANEDVAAAIANTYDAIVPDNDSGGSNDGGGGGASKPSKKRYRYKAQLTYINKDYGQQIATGNGDYKDTEADAKADAKSKAKANAKNFRDTVSVTYEAYKKGGIADFTGPAWLDGTPREPERVLSPKQTELFETMVRALESMSRISVPTMPNYGSMDFAGGSGVSVGDIIVNVDNLDTDDDYEELAKKVSDILMERIGRTTVVGGIRIN